MTKRLLAFFIMVLLICAPIIGMAQGYTSIIDLREVIPERWMQTYETNWRTIVIDVEPIVPSVAEVPILKVSPDHHVPNTSVMGDDLEASLNSASALVNLNSKRFEQFSRDITDAQKKLDAKTISSEYYPPFDLNKIYAENTGLTLGDAIQVFKDAMTALGEEPEEWDYARPIRVLCNKTITQTGDYVTSGSYSLRLNQKLAGIPLYIRPYGKEQEMSLWTFLNYRIVTVDTYDMGWQKVKIDDVVVEDVPLCTFSTIQTAIEEEVYAGHLRKIFDLEFGYALFNEPDSTRGKIGSESTTYYAYPVWKIACLYNENAKQELQDNSDDGVNERSGKDFSTILFDAQTGEMLDHQTKQKGSGSYKGFISWGDIGGKQ